MHILKIIHTHASSHARWNTHTHTSTHNETRAARWRIYPEHARTATHMHMHIHTLKPPAYARTQLLTHTHTHTYTHTHTLRTQARMLAHTRTNIHPHADTRTTVRSEQIYGPMQVALEIGYNYSNCMAINMLIAVEIDCGPGYGHCWNTIFHIGNNLQSKYSQLLSCL